MTEAYKQFAPVVAYAKGELGESASGAEGASEPTRRYKEELGTYVECEEKIYRALCQVLGDEAPTGKKDELGERVVQYIMHQASIKAQE